MDQLSSPLKRKASPSHDLDTSTTEPDLQDFIEKNETPTLDQAAAVAYWTTITLDDAGVLGGYPHVSRADLQGSANFLTKLRRKRGDRVKDRLGRVVDCGAGIGRVTAGFLANVAEVVDVVEPVKRLTDVISTGEGFKGLREQGRIGTVYNLGLENWTPSTKYDIIWTQWCIGQLSDEQMISYLQRCTPWLAEGGWIVVKENMSTDPEGRDVFDATDNSLTRTDGKFRELFVRANLRIVATEVQKGMPREIYPVRSYALRPN